MYKYPVFVACIVFIGECLHCVWHLAYTHRTFTDSLIQWSKTCFLSNEPQNVHFVIHSIVIHHVECGVGRNSQQHMSRQMDQYDQNGYNPNAYNNNNNYNYNNANQRNPNVANKNVSRSSESTGLSAWGLITIIMLIIGIGMAGYYGIICYPLICKEERNYDIMDAASTTASANTPTRSSDFEKSGNYSSRSTTPSVIISA